MPNKVARIFVDEQNFIRRWRAATDGADLDWLQLPSVLGVATRKVLVTKGAIKADLELSISNTSVYLSAFDPNDVQLAKIVEKTGIARERLDHVRRLHRSRLGALTKLLREPDWKVIRGDVLVDDDPKTLLCMRCERPVTACQRCGGEDIVALREKGVDMQLGADMVDGAWLHAIDARSATPNPTLHVAILVSADADLIPAVRSVRSKGVRVVNATWRTNTGRLPAHCDAIVYLDDHVNDLTLEAPPPTA